MPTHWSEPRLSTLAHLAAEMAWHLQHHSLNPSPWPPPAPHWAPSCLSCWWSPVAMNLHMAPPNPGPGGHSLLLERKCCRMPVRDPPLARSARAPGQLGIRRAGCRAPGRPQPTPLCFYRPTAVSTWDKAPETHRPPVGPPAPSPAGSSGHRRWTGHGFGWSRCSVASPKCSRSSEITLWGHNPGQNQCPEKLDPPRPCSTHGLGQWAWQGWHRP